jgi:hypothetical protein
MNNNLIISSYDTYFLICGFFLYINIRRLYTYSLISTITLRLCATLTSDTIQLQLVYCHFTGGNIGKNILLFRFL